LKISEWNWLGPSTLKLQRADLRAGFHQALIPFALPARPIGGSQSGKDDFKFFVPLGLVANSLKFKNHKNIYEES